MNSQLRRSIQSRTESGPFDQLLAWLDSDRDKAVERFLHIRKTLVKVFECRSFSDAEDLADEAIDRVVAKVPSIVPSFQGDPSLYFYGVARHVAQEYVRRRKSSDLPHDLVAPEIDRTDAETELSCLDECLSSLTGHERDFIMRYYSYESPSVKSAVRKRFAEELGITLANIRIRAYRVRSKVQACVENCVSG